MFSHQPLKTAVLSSGSDVWFKLTNVFHFTAYFILDENLPLLAALQTKRRTHSEIRTITNDNNGTVEAWVTYLWNTTLPLSPPLSPSVSLCQVPLLPLIFLPLVSLSSLFLSQSFLWSSSFLLTSLSPSSTAFSLLCKLLSAVITFTFASFMPCPEIWPHLHLSSCEHSKNTFSFTLNYSKRDMKS